MKKIIIYSFIFLSACMAACSSDNGGDDEESFKQWQASATALEKNTGTYAYESNKTSNQTYLVFSNGIMRLVTYESGKWSNSAFDYTIEGDSIHFIYRPNTAADGKHTAYIQFVHGITSNKDQLLIRGLDDTAVKYFPSGYFDSSASIDK